MAQLVHPSNWRSQLEREIVIAASPRDFTENYVVASIRAYQAREIFAEMGFELAPGFMDHNEFLYRLQETPRLNDQEIARFDELLLKRG